MKQHPHVCCIHPSEAVIEVTLLLILINKSNEAACGILPALLSWLQAKGFKDDLGKLAMQHRCRVRSGGRRKGIPLLTCCKFSLTDHTNKKKCRARLKNLTMYGSFFLNKIKHTVDNWCSYMQIVYKYTILHPF